MAPVLPSSLSPHICILPSPDLTELLETSGLPGLPNILQSFSPLPQVTTRTTSLVSVPHSSFALRFSDLSEIEEACREPEEQRAARTLDWMAVRITKRCEKWVQDIEEKGEPREERIRSPWWDELRRCAEGDYVPDRTEAWNHPVAVILAVSTASPNPLQVITELHSRPIQLPAWVDQTYLKYTLIIHPNDSPLSDEEANALFNAVKKQYGLQTYLLPLALPSPPPPPIPVPALMPRLPPPPGPDSSYTPRKLDAIPPTPLTANAPDIPSNPYALNTLRLDEKDIQATARFTREFVVMSLIPWMERCVVEWNEAYSSTRRLPSRLFSSTRRLFGSSASPSPTPTHTTSSSISSLPGHRGSVSSNTSPLGPLAQPRRLAEFATILGDFKLAITLWESMRKESKGGSDVIPILSSPNPALQLLASNALLSVHPPVNDPPPHGQLRALLYAVRWEMAISQGDFLSDTLEGERWLVWAAGNAEEAPSALLLAHAALLSSAKKNAYRRAAFWYASAANKLEKCGIKPLTVYFLRKAQELFEIRPPKELSPSFWESEGKSESAREDFVDVRAGVEHPLARLLYTTGNITEAVRTFLGSLRVLEYPTLQPAHDLDGEYIAPPPQDKTFLDDFRVAFAHLSSTNPDSLTSLDWKLPLQFSRPEQCKIRFAYEEQPAGAGVREKRESQWRAFWKARGGKEPLVTGRKVCVGETFWVDLQMLNPLDTDLEIANLELIVQGKDSAGPLPRVEVEPVHEVTLKAKESQTVSIAVRVLEPTTIVVSQVKYDFLSVLSVTESLASRGPRLHATPAQMRSVTYGPDVYLKVDVAPSDNKLSVAFADDSDILLKHGEIREMSIQLTNTGRKPISEVWLVMGGEEELWVGREDESDDSRSSSEIIRSKNSLKCPDPLAVPLPEPLQPGVTTDVSLCIHVEQPGSQEFQLLFLFRESESSPFYSVQVTKAFEVQPLLDIGVSSNPSRSKDSSFVLDIEATSLSPSTSVTITQVTTISPLWKFRPIEANEASISPSQTAKFVLGGDQWLEGEGKKESLDFLVRQLEDVLAGAPTSPLDPPEVDLVCSHAIQNSSQQRSIESPRLWNLVQAGKRRFTAEVERLQHPHIPEDSHPQIFPLYNPASVDVVVFWSMPAQKREGHIVAYGVRLGATHGALEEIISFSENSKVKRSMYAETVREKVELIEGIRSSEWNADMDPTVATIQSGEACYDFSKGPCHVPVNVIIRNHSPLFAAKITFRLRSGLHPPQSPDSAAFTPAQYSGRLAFRCTLQPGEVTTLQPRILVDRAGLYSVGSFVAETELLIGESKKKRTYVQEHPPPADVCIIVRDSSL
ncbi:ER-golgi trafficking TRAPP I complex 85 kDa subunit-domain-containing protein [Coprinopsis sp. MPI-PUGE-AT-0042]|nr:ER-golgi trafficking TRAPP I complex 85 kDa subunit-domain-containing protein [Coprinopsis sp. MPI-PUGE-AT-0042]